MSDEPDDNKVCAHCVWPPPHCEYHHCEKKANWSVWMPNWTKGSGGKPGHFKFFCHDCLAYYTHAMTTPMKGIDRPADADEDWKPSILEHIRHARIAMDFNDRNDGAGWKEQDRQIGLIRDGLVKSHTEDLQKRAGDAA